MGKRASVSNAKAAAAKAAITVSPAKSPAKKQRSEAFVKTDPLLLEACQPIFKALKADGKVPDDADKSGTEMLCAVLPFALRTVEAAEKRHDYQEKMLDAVAEQLASVVAARKDDVQAVEKEIIALKTEESDSACKYEEIVSRIAALAKECDKADAVCQTRGEALAAAQAALKVAEDKAAGTDKELQAIVDDRASFETGLAELWAPLKASELRGQQWRKRDELLARLMEKMEPVGVEKSLQAGLQQALKTVVNQRSDFANATITCAEEVYARHMESLQEAIDGFGETKSARVVAVAEAKAGVDAASDAHDAALAASIQAQNAWAQETGVELEHKTRVEAFAPTLDRLGGKLARAQDRFADSQMVSDSFAALRPISAALQKASVLSEEATA